MLVLVLAEVTSVSPGKTALASIPAPAELYVCAPWGPEHPGRFSRTEWSVRDLLMPRGQALSSGHQLPRPDQRYYWPRLLPLPSRPRPPISLGDLNSGHLSGSPFKTINHIYFLILPLRVRAHT